MNEHIAEPGPASSPGQRRPPGASRGPALLAAGQERAGEGEPKPDPPGPDGTRGCLFALSQPPLMFFLALIGCLLLLAAVHDLYVD